MTFDVTILGCGAATPTTKHNPSAQFLNVDVKVFFLDEFNLKRTRTENFFLQEILSKSNLKNWHF